MGLIITGDIQIQGNDGLATTIESVYARLEAALRPDGKNVEIAFSYIFVSKEAYKLNAPMLRANINTSVTGEVLDQSMLTIHELAKSHLESQGFTVEIDL